MSEGTKLGEFDNQTEFKTSMNETAGEAENLKGTKIGDLSSLEQELVGSEESNQSEETKSEGTVEEQVESTQTVETEKAEADNAEVLAVQPPSLEVIKEETVEEVETTTDSDAAVNTDENSEAVEEETQETEEVVASSNSEANEMSSFFEQELDRLDVDIEEGDIVEGTVRSVEKSGVLVDIGFKSDGFIPNEEFSNDSTVTPKNTLSEGDKVSAVVEKLETKQGYTKLSRKKAEFELTWNEIIDLSRSKEIVEVKIASKVQGGLVSEYKGIKGFIPASQVVKEKEQDLDEFVKSTMRVVVLKADRNRRKVIFSHKMAENKKPRVNIDELISGLDIGHVLDGRVSTIKDFGVFVDIGGVEGLVHISELSWSRISHPKEIIEQGQEVKVFVLGVDRENRRISLGMKQLEPDPWVKAQEKYSVGQVVQGTVSRCVTFGAFVLLEDNLEGLIHISELSNQHVESVESVVSVGEEITATIIKVIPDEQKIGLSLKATQANKTTEEVEV